MKNLHLLLIGIMCMCNSIFALDTLRVESQIKEVTIFFDGAQVMREAALKIEKGPIILLLSGLPADIITKSLQVKSIKNCKIRSVKTMITPMLDKEKETDIKKLEKQIQSNTQKIKDIKNSIDVFQREERILLDNSQIGTSTNGVKISDLKEAADFFRNRLNDIKKNIFKLEENINTIVEESFKLFGELNRLEAMKEKKETKLYITIDAEEKLSDKIQFSYFITRAKWTASYDFRVNDINEPLTLVYQANIFQTTGEDWKDVKIKLSATNPTLSNNKPDLAVWYAHKPVIQTRETTQSIYENDGTIRGNHGSIRGVIKDARTDEPIPFANVVIEMEGRQIGGASSDLDGNFRITPVNPGKMNLKVSSVGYTQLLITNLLVSPEQITFKNVNLEPNSEMLAQCQIVEYAVPLISKDYTTSGGTMTSSEIRKMPARSTQSFSTTVGGVFSADNEIGSVKGARNEGGLTYIDGVKVRGYANNEQSYRSPNYSNGSNYEDFSTKIETNNLIENVLKNQVANIEYQIETPYTILCDGEEYMIQIKEVKIPVDYMYHIIPKKDRDAFLVANITDWIPLNLIDGKTSVYFQGTFVGESYLNTKILKDTLSVSLGRDRGIYVERTYKKEISNRITTGNYYKQYVAWHINVKNNKTVPVKIIVEENYPLSELKTITVEFIETSDGKIDDIKNIIRWEFNLDAGETKNILFNYSIKYPRHQTIYFD